MAREIINYIVVAKQLESGKFLISFPDFEGITTTAETEENIQKVSLELIKTKLEELKKANIEIPEPKKITEISKNLKEGEFTTYIPVKESFNFKDKEAVKENIKDMTIKVDNFINSDIKKYIPEGKEHLLGLAGGILSILNTLFFSIIKTKSLFGFGGGSVNFFSSGVNFMLIFFGLLFLAGAGVITYSSFVKNQKMLRYSFAASVGIFVAFYVMLFIGASGNEYISISFLKILLYIVSFILVFISYKFLNTSEYK